MTTAHHERSAIGAMYAGLGLTVAAIIVAYVDHATANVLAGHIRAGYPTYTQAPSVPGRPPGGHAAMEEIVTGGAWRQGTRPR